MRIPEDKVEEIRSASDIVDVVGDYVRLKKTGASFKGLCPFHEERTPSFNVNPGMQIYKCFGCNAGGDVFEFVKAMEHLEFPDAVRLLGERAGIEIPQEEVTTGSSEKDSIFAALRFAAKRFHRLLTESDAGTAALAYLRDERSMTDETIKSFGVGYATNEWQGLLDDFEGKFSAEVLSGAGLVISREGRAYDRFRGRIIFPIISHVGKVVGFGGRVFDGDGDQPKYINSPETQVYHKSHILYGLYHSRQAIRASREVVVVEGYTDVILLHQAGIQNVVASSGTALTQDQVRLLKRYCDRAVLIYDADSAGAAAMLRGIDIVLGEGLSVYLVSLPAGEDPDTFVRDQGQDGFRKYLSRERKDFVEFKYGLLDAIESATPEDRVQAQREVLASIARIQDPLMQEEYVRRAAAVMDVPDVKLHQAMRRMRSGGKRAPRRRESPPPADVDSVMQPKQRVVLPEEKTLLRLMLKQGTAMVAFILGNMALDEFTEGPSREMASLLLQMYQRGHIDLSSFVGENAPEDIRMLASDVLVPSHEPSDNWTRQNIEVPRLDQRPYESAASAMTLLKLDRVKEEIDKHQLLLAAAAEAGDEDAERSLQNEMIQLFELRKAVEERKYLDGHKA